MKVLDIAAVIAKTRANKNRNRKTAILIFVQTGEQTFVGIGRGIGDSQRVAWIARVLQNPFAVLRRGDGDGFSMPAAKNRARQSERIFRN